MTKKGNPSRVKIAICYRSKSAYIPTDIKVLQTNWDKTKGKVFGISNKVMLNNAIAKKKNEVDALVLKYNQDNKPFSSVYEIRDLILKELGLSKADAETTMPTFASYFKHFAMQKTNSKTQSVYLFTLKRMSDYDSNINTRRFEDITKNWLVGFDNHLSITSISKNGRNVHLRNIRAVFNDAIENDITSFYPFKSFKIRPVATRKRSLTVDELRTLMNYPVETHLQRYVDVFMLSFFLIGINLFDLCHAKTICNGRLEYIRAKTGRLYSIKIEPEAQTIIDKYRGKEHLLSILENNRNYQDFLCRINKLNFRKCHNTLSIKSFQLC